MFQCRIDDESELRIIEPHHAQELNKLITDNFEHLREWSRWLTNNDRPIEKTREWIAQNLEHFGAGEGYDVGIWHRGKMVGQIGYNHFDPQDQKTEIGYWIAADAQGKGLVTRSCIALVDNAFTNLKLNRIELHCGTENLKSRRIAERLGFKEEGVERQAEWLHDRFIDLVVYSMLKTEWNAVDKALASNIA
ncbi:MAG TPA: GNAT family protein, partial [Pyrinomonadaceae bacterium]|nr:GNAT family protein [Pyrinomonadaceae bacterium]